MSVLPLKYYAKSHSVFLSHAESNKPSKFICRATSKRLAQKIASNMNLLESRKQKCHEIYMTRTAGNGDRLFADLISRKLVLAGLYRSGSSISAMTNIIEKELNQENQ